MEFQGLAVSCVGLLESGRERGTEEECAALRICFLRRMSKGLHYFS